MSHKCCSTTINKEYLREIIILTKDMWFINTSAIQLINYIRFFHSPIKFFLQIIVRILFQRRLMNPASTNNSWLVRENDIIGHDGIAQIFLLLGFYDSSHIIYMKPMLLIYRFLITHDVTWGIFDTLGINMVQTCNSSTHCWDLHHHQMMTRYYSTICCHNVN